MLERSNFVEFLMDFGGPDGAKWRRFCCYLATLTHVKLSSTNVSFQG